MSDFFIHPVYLSARAAIVAPEKAIPVTLYSVQKWLPRLGPERWCLVMLLRSLSIGVPRRSDGTKRITCSWRELAKLLDVHEETVASWLKHQPIPNDKPWRKIAPIDEKSNYLALFIPRLRYAYETRNGKTRRTGFMLEILMEDPIAPEDEARLQQRLEILQMQQGELGLETYRLTEDVNKPASSLPQLSQDLVKPEDPDLHYVNQLNLDSATIANPSQLDLHNVDVNPEKSDLRAGVKQHNVELDIHVNKSLIDLHNDESEESEKNVNELDILIQQLKHSNLKRPRKHTLEPIVGLTEVLLNDDHSAAMFYKVLNTLYPERLDLYVAAVRVAIQTAKSEPNVNPGAVFVRALRDFADVAGIDLGLKRTIAGSVNNSKTDDEQPRIGVPKTPAESLTPPSVNEAIWAETQSMLRRQMTQATYDAVIQGTRLTGREDGGIYVISVHTEMAKEWLENRLQDVVQRALSNVVGVPVKVKFRLMGSTK